MSFHDCTTTINSDGTSTVCSAPTLSDASVLAYLATVIALLWPDLAEFSILGVSVKREIEATKAKVDDVRQVAAGLDTAVGHLQQEVRQLSVSSARADVNINQFGPADAAVLAQAVRELRTDDTATASPSRAESREETLDRVRATGNVITAWNELSDLLGLTTLQGRLVVGSPEKDPELWDRQLQFAQQHADDIELLRRLRNEASHSALISSTNLRLGAQLGEGLVRAARTAMAMPDTSAASQ